MPTPKSGPALRVQRSRWTSWRKYTSISLENPSCIPQQLYGVVKTRGNKQNGDQNIFTARCWAQRFGKSDELKGHKVMSMNDKFRPKLFADDKFDIKIVIFSLLFMPSFAIFVSMFTKQNLSFSGFA